MRLTNTRRRRQSFIGRVVCLGRGGGRLVRAERSSDRVTANAPYPLSGMQPEEKVSGMSPAWDVPSGSTLTFISRPAKPTKRQDERHASPNRQHQQSSRL